MTVARRKDVEGQAHSATAVELCCKEREAEVDLQMMRTQLFAVGVVEMMRTVAQLGRSSLVPLAEKSLLTVTWLSCLKWDFYMLCVSLPYLPRYNSGSLIGANERCVLNISAGDPRRKIEADSVMLFVLEGMISNTKKDLKNGVGYQCDGRMD